MHSRRWSVTMQGLGPPVLIATPFPVTSDHNSRHLELGPDMKLYISYGSPANVDTCEKYTNGLNACSIVRMNLNGTGLENYLVGEYIISNGKLERAFINHTYLCMLSLESAACPVRQAITNFTGSFERYLSGGGNNFSRNSILHRQHF